VKNVSPIVRKLMVREPSDSLFVTVWNTITPTKGEAGELFKRSERRGASIRLKGYEYTFLYTTYEIFL
jgi:hypothetical protein